MDELVSDFVCEAVEALAGLQSGLANMAAGCDGAEAETMRRLHGLKGLCGLAGLARAEALCHAGETLVDALAKGPAPSSTLAAFATLVERLGELFSTVAVQGAEPHGADSELIVALGQAAAHARGRIADPGPLQAPLERYGWAGLSATGADRRTHAPWSGLDTLARTLGDRLGKRIDLVVGGDDLRIASTATTSVRSVLIALVRNACDHGIEMPDERRRLGKPPLALVRLSVHGHSDGGSIEVADDGRGIDPDLHAWVFEPGASTAEALTPLSGRGVGLDLVRRQIETLGGSVRLTSEPGRGCRFLLSLPAAAIATADGRATRAA